MHLLNICGGVSMLPVNGFVCHGFIHTQAIDILNTSRLVISSYMDEDGVYTKRKKESVPAGVWTCLVVS